MYGKQMMAFGVAAAMAMGMMTVPVFAEEKEPVTIKWISQGLGENGWEGKIVPILEAFEEKTGIHVETEFYSFDDLFEVIETKSASGNADYDVMSVDVTYVSKYGTSGYLEPLDQFFSDEEKEKWDEASYIAGVWENTMYAAPMTTSSQILWFNKTLLEEAGIEVPENDPDNRLTFEQVADLASQALEILDPDGTRGLVGFDFQQVSRLYQMNELPNSMGGANISDDGYSIDGVVNTQPWIDAMTWYQGIVNDGIASRGYDADQLGELFNSGKVIFMIGGTWTSTDMTCDDEIDCVYVPCFEGYEDQIATPTGGWYFGISSSSEHMNEAAELIKYFNFDEGARMFYEADGNLPPLLEMQEEIRNSEDESKWMKMAAYETANTAFPRAVTPVFGEYSTILNQAWEDVRNGEDVETTLNNAVTQFNAAVASYK